MSNVIEFMGSKRGNIKKRPKILLIQYLVNAEVLGVSMKPLDNLQIQNIVSFQSLDNQVRQQRQTLYNPQNYNNILLECNDNNSVVPFEMDVKNIYKIPNFTFNPSFIK